MKAIITGGGGFIGSHIARLLKSQSHEVTALGRRHYPDLEAQGIACVRADIRDRDALTQAFAGHDVVFHVAALAMIWGPKRTFREINVEGTRSVIHACRAASVRKLIFTSSPSVMFGVDGRFIPTPDQPFPSRHLAHYPSTKAIAEQIVQEATDDELLTVSLRPHLVWGPGDPHLIPRALDRARAGQLIQVGDGTNLVDVTYIVNVAHAHVKAAEALEPGAPCVGQGYFISQGEPVNLWSWLGRVVETVGAPPVNRQMSYKAAYRRGALLETMQAITGYPREPVMTRFLAAQLSHDHYFDIEPAQKDLGYEVIVGMEEGLAETVECLKTHVLSK